MNCNYKVKIQDIQTKYKFKVFCAGGGDSETKEKVDILYNIWPRVIAEGETITLDNTAEAPLEIVLNGNTSGDNAVTGDNSIVVCGKNLAYTGWAEDFVSRINNSIYAKIEIKDNKTCLKWIASAGYPNYDTKYIFKTDWKENTQYTFAMDLFATNDSNRDNLQIAYTDGTFTEINSTYNTWSHIVVTSNANKTIKYICPYYRSNETYLDLDTFMVYEGTDTTVPYEQYKGASYPINLGSIELNAGDSIQYLTDKWYIVRADTTQTEITDTTLINQLEALKEAQSYSGQTNILQVNNDAPFIITAKALMDLSYLGTNTVSTLNTASVNRLGTPVFNQSIDPVNLELNSEDLELNNEEETIEETPEEE